MTKRRITIILLLMVIISISLLMPVFTYANSVPTINSSYAVLMDASTGQVLYNKGMHTRSYPASITKIMTTILAIEKGGLDTVFTVNEATCDIESNSSNIYLTPGEKLTIEQLIYGTMLNSGNDAANALAQYVSGTIPVFAERMTQKAKELGALNTNFTNANGLHNENHYTTAYDMAVIMNYAMTLPKFREVVSTLRYQIPATNNYKEIRYLKNTHKLLEARKYDYAVGGKTGWTTPAGNTLVTFAEKDGRSLIAVILKGNNSIEVCDDTVRLLEYGFNDFKDYFVSKSSLKVPSIDVVDNGKVVGEVEYFATKDFKFLIPKNANDSSIVKEYIVPEDVEKDKQLVAQVKFSLDDENISSTIPPDLLTVSLVPSDIKFEDKSDNDSKADDAENSNDNVSNPERKGMLSSTTRSDSFSIFQKVCFTIAGILIVLLLVATTIRVYNKSKKKRKY